MNLSVCLASYNGSKYIFDQISSILSQLGDNDELIICDDGSIDNTVDIIKGFTDSRIRLYEYMGFFNPIFNFEKAISYSTKDIIVLSDQDDIWVDNRVEIIKEYFYSTENTSFNLLVMDAEGIDSNGEIIYPSMLKYLKASRGVFKNLKKNSYIGCCLAFTEDVKSLVLPFPKDIPMHDIWIGMICDLFGCVYFDYRISLVYRRHGENFTRDSYSVFKSLYWRISLLLSLIMRVFSLIKSKKFRRGK